MVRRVLLSQVNHVYGRNTFLPYSVGLLQAYAQGQPDLREAYEFLPLVFRREDPREVIRRTPRPDILGLSLYLWNEQWSLEMAREAREAWPDCLIVCGGPQVPERAAESYLRSYQMLDMLVHHEGEHAFASVLRERLKERPHYGIIPGLTYWGTIDSLQHPEGTVICSGAARRIEDLDALPSPYLAGVFDSMPWEDYDFHATQETHRGCPYACTFCDWGSAIFTKVRAFKTERLYEEIDWFADRKIELLYNADANYGLLARDIELTGYLAARRRLQGYPKQFRAAYAKNANEKIFQIARTLSEADMSKGVTLSLQSTDPHTLEAIKRKNIAMEDFEGWVKRYEESGISTYTELILGLPGETYDTFADGIERVLRAGQHHGLHIYLCLSLPNSELSDPEYVKTHRIRTVRGPLLQQHATPDPTAEEIADIVIETSTMPERDWIRAFLFSWAVQTFHCLGLTTGAARAAVETGATYRQFYESLLDYFATRPWSAIGSEQLRATALIVGGLEGGAWGTTMQGCGDVIWPPEEASFLFLANHAKQTYRELEEWLSAIQSSFPVVSRAHLVTDECSLVLPGDRPFNGDRERWSREVLWYGRKTRKFLKGASP